MELDNTNPNSLTNGESHAEDDGAFHGLLRDLKSQLSRLPEDSTLIKQIVDSALNENEINDQESEMEHIIQLAASYPKGSPTVTLLTDAFIKNLWNNLKHPPVSYMGDLWRYRTADGSNNSVLFPQLGRSGSAYARSVVSQRPLQAALPDPGDIFDALFARKGPAKQHPAKFTSFAFSIATVIIHDVFRTNDVDQNMVQSSSYLDLGPLYGHDQAMQDTVRTFKDGKLKPDTFAEPRILGQLPVVGALLVSFNRFHNYVAEQLAEINEGGRFTVSTLNKGADVEMAKAEAKRDNDLFQTARLITCGLYVNVILHDYVRVILNLNRTNSTWNLDPRDSDFDIFDQDGTPKGLGNQVSVEFNLIYRWHSTISDKSDDWLRNFMGELWPGKQPEDLTQADLLDGLKRYGHSMDPDPAKWTFGDMKRNAAGGFDDAALATIIVSAIEDNAGAFGARNVPTAMRAIEILGINQGRNWGVASLNEVRKFFNLRPHKTFLDINPDPDVAASFEALYQHVDNVEFYPGMACEETKEPMVPGSGLCAGLTVIKAILSDAVSLVRGDRFYTIDSSPANLTHWGFNEIASDPDVAAGGCLYKVLQRALPNWFKPNSVYVLFPTIVPTENRAIMASLGTEWGYDYDPPSFTPQPTPLVSWKGVTSVLNDQETFKVPFAPHIMDLFDHDFMLGGDKPWNASSKQLCMHAFYDPVKGLSQISDFYNVLTTNLIKSSSVKLRDRWQMDIVRDVVIPSHTIAAARFLGIPLKESEEEKGPGLTVKEFYDVMGNLFWYCFADVDPAETMRVRVAAKSSASSVLAVVTEACKQIESGNLLQEVFSKFRHNEDQAPLPEYGIKLLQRLKDAGTSIKEIIYLIAPMASAMAPQMVPATTRILDFYLSPENAAYWADIQAIAASDSPDDLEKLRKYTLEALRISPPLAGTLRIVGTPTASITDAGKTLTFAENSAVFIVFGAAGMDPSVFPDPQEVKLDRPDDLYIHHGYGGHACLGRKMVEAANAVQLRLFARLKNLRRAAGPPGEVKKTVIGGASSFYMDEEWSEWRPYPSTWKLQYDL